MSVEPEYTWPQPPVGGYRAEDLDRLPHLPPHTELIDGSLVFVSPQTKFHMRAMRLLENRLLQAAPPELEVVREMTVTLGPRNRPEADVMVVRADADTGLRQTSYRPEDVLLAIEVVSEDSEERDRDAKPRKSPPPASRTTGGSRTTGAGPSSTSSSWSRRHARTP